MINGIHPIITWLISMSIFVFVVSAAQSQEVIADHPFVCVADAENLTLSAWGLSIDHYDISDDAWQDMLQLTGDDIWVGYENGGWDMPSDIYGKWQIQGDDMEVWLWVSDGTGEYFVFPFSNTKLFADNDGNHYGMHPCGGWSVDAAALDEVIDEVRR